MKKLYIALLLSCCSILPLFSKQDTEMAQSFDIIDVINENRHEPIFRKVQALLESGAKPDTDVINALIDRAGQKYQAFNKTGNNRDYALLSDTQQTLNLALDEVSSIQDKQLEKAKEWFGEKPNIDFAQWILKALQDKAKGKGKA